MELPAGNCAGSVARRQATQTSGRYTPPTVRASAGEAGSRLDDATQLVGGPWRVVIYEDAAEVVAVRDMTPSSQDCTFEDLAPQLPGLEAARQGVESDRGAQEAARRARAALRRYCVRNRLDRLWTLTYAGAGEFDEDRVARDVARFVKVLRDAQGGGAFPYAWVRELHPGGHGFHVHLALARYVPKVLVERAWHCENARAGFVDGRRIETRQGGGRNQARAAARYLSKYVAKEAERAVTRGKRRYCTGQGFAVRRVEALAFDLAEARHIAKLVVGEDISWQWSSVEVDDWKGPPCVLWVF